MLIAVVVLSVLSVVLAVSTYLMYRGALAFLNDSERYRKLYQLALETLGEIETQLAAVGFRFVSKEEAAKANLSQSPAAGTHKKPEDLH